MGNIVNNLKDKKIKSIKNIKKGKIPARRRFIVDFNKINNIILY